MERSIKIYIIVTAAFVLVVGLAIYAGWDKQNQENKAVTNIDANDPLLTKAKVMARASLDTLYVLYSNHTGKCFVKFADKNDQGDEQHRWGQLKDLERDHVSLIIKQPSANGNGIDQEKERQLPIEQVEDWLVELDSNKVRGGYTTQAILMQQKGLDKKTVDDQLSLFIDKL